MKKFGAMLLSVSIILSVILNICVIPASALIVSNWGVISFSSIYSQGYDINNNPVNISESLSGSNSTITNKYHYKDTVQVNITTGSITNMEVTLDGIPLTSKNMTISSERYYESTFDLYYWESTLTFTNLSDLGINDASESILKIVTHNPNNNSLTAGGWLTIKWQDNRPDAPTTPTFIYDDSDNAGKAVLTGIDTTMEYRLKSEPDTWETCTGTSMAFDLPTADTVYYVRYADPQSQVKSVTLLAPDAASVSIDTTTEAFSGLKTTMEMSFDGGYYFDVTDDIIASGASSYIDQVSAGSTGTLTVRIKKTETNPTGQEQVLTLYPRLSSPTGITYDPVTCLVSGVTTAMQYRLQGATSWTAISSTPLNVKSLLSDSADVMIEIRYKPVSGVSSASKVVEVTLQQLAADPKLTLDLANEIISGFDSDSTYEYNTTGSLSSWTTITLEDGKFDISSLISSSADKTFYIRKAATDTLPATAATQITVSKRPSAPTTPTFVYNDTNHPEQAVLTGLTSDMEYRISMDTAWTPCTGNDIIFDIPSANATYYVRTKGVGTTTTASANKTLTLYKRASAPSVTLNITTETIGSLTTAMEIGTDGVNFTPVTTATSNYDVSGLIDATLTGTASFYVRTAATATAPTSSTKVILLYPRLSTPTGITYDPITCLVSGVSSAMQYEVPGTTSWTAISSTILNVESLLSNSDDVVIEIRYKPVSGVSSASKALEVTLDQLPAAPTLTLNLEAETVEGCVNGETYQYGTNGSTWTSAVAEDNSINIASAISTSKAITLYVRKAATTTDPATTSTTFSISKRGTAPSAPAFVYNSVNHPGKAVLGSIDSTIEYRKSTDTEWTDCPNDILVFDIPSASTTYYVRYKGFGNTTPASANKTLTLATNGTAPSVSYNITTEILSNVTTAMETSINGGEYTAFTATTYSCEDLIDAISSDKITVLSIRKQATSTAPASKTTAITLYARVAAPVGPAYDETNQKITGVDSTMQYRAVGATSWSTISSSATTISVSSLITSGYTQVEVRYKPVSGVSSASQAVTIDIY